MSLHRALPFAKKLLSEHTPEGGITVDATAGNGHDTIDLAKLAGPAGTVYSFDIQHAAIEATQKKLTDHKLDGRVVLVNDGHENMKTYIAPEHAGRIDTAVFNLGYLPGSDKTVSTQADTTIAAIETLLTSLRPGGIIVLVIYHGHEEGRREKETLMTYLASLPQEKADVLLYAFLNQKNEPPFLAAIEKKADA
ncbi:tRNA (mnm(5)s(2)U34)-methyltransferase [Salisediminibacterium halotolerans]|uniref:tRNA (mnm(5)s(2)U34)-methyltransferase n=1 Tax=Salisediminibacterium halotolerans TaxID=517425 RepID=UPI000EB1F20C|nr:class I SAM-dependent methyltransferase [Salisediminibacterium halotolerans]RLJ69428.1 putative rRNA methylase [Actinophytocola xinjiangensis]RPE83946.1 putative rRNA methylase [Salisediminibacterium halotolerans]TWG32503.1 putative rRNA methylase [Salisediminibacterium halotolerans]GEL07656.1 rRNA methyltransferase [Salisediminibacterium halotolerans]